MLHARTVWPTAVYQTLSAVALPPTVGIGSFRPRFLDFSGTHVPTILTWVAGVRYPEWGTTLQGEEILEDLFTFHFSFLLLTSLSDVFTTRVLFLQRFSYSIVLFNISKPKIIPQRGQSFKPSTLLLSLQPFLIKNNCNLCNVWTFGLMIYRWNLHKVSLEGYLFFFIFREYEKDLEVKKVKELERKTLKCGKRNVNWVFLSNTFFILIVKSHM